LYAKYFLVFVIQQRGILKNAGAVAFSKVSLTQACAGVFILENSRVSAINEMSRFDQNNTFDADDLPLAFEEDVPLARLMHSDDTQAGGKPEPAVFQQHIQARLKLKLQ